MTTRAKPDFSVGGGGMVDPEFIPADVRRELLLHLEKSPLTGEQKKALIQYANDMGQTVMDGELLPAQKALHIQVLPQALAVVRRFGANKNA